MSRVLVSFILLSGMTTLSVSASESLHITPDDDMGRISMQLAADLSIKEVVLADGVYRQRLMIRKLENGEPNSYPLIIRPAEGARVIFDGGGTITGARRVKELPGVYSIPYDGGDSEPPSIWEPDPRVRYTLVADADAVDRFPASYAILDGRILFHTSDGSPPRSRSIRISQRDFGLSIDRPHVTVRNLEFRDFVARGRSSTAIRINADHVTVDSCSVSNASFGFIVAGDQGAVVRCVARDVGGGVYLSGAGGRVEDCRFFKEQDSFAIPTYAQDDTGIQFYFPANGGEVRRNLIVGFEKGILVKAKPAQYTIEENTLVGIEGRIGFAATSWVPESAFRRNVVSGFSEPIRIPSAGNRRGVRENCYSPAVRLEPGSLGPDSIVGNPQFMRPEAEDYRLAPESECRAGRTSDARIGAFSSDSEESAPLNSSRDWHVSPAGRDGNDGTDSAPVRTVQFAVDRARPGDTILLHPGLYSDPISIRAGGTAGRPLTLRALKKWEAVLDGGRRTPIMIDIDGAPFVQIRDLEVRWYRQDGIRVKESSDVVVSGCRIWNAFWRGIWPTGIAVHVERSPRFTGDHNVLFRQEHGFVLHTSPESELTFNTCAGNLYSAATFIHSIEGSVCRNNSFAFQGNDVLQIDVGPGENGNLQLFNCDFNNYGTNVREQPEGVAVDRILPRPNDRGLQYESKAIVRYREGNGEFRRFLTMEEWRRFSSLDIHSIFADPLYRSMVSNDFRLLPESPNIEAGTEGLTIGAHQ